MRSVDIRPAPVERHPGTTGLATVLPQHADEHSPECPVLLAVDQELGEVRVLVIRPLRIHPGDGTNRSPQ